MHNVPEVGDSGHPKLEHEEKASSSAAEQIVYAVTIRYTNEGGRSGNEVRTEHNKDYDEVEALITEEIEGFSCHCGSGPDETDGEIYAECTTCRMTVEVEVQEV